MTADSPPAPGSPRSSRRLHVASTTPQPVDRARLQRAVAAANLPTLAMVLFQLTGDERWITDPFRPTIGRGLSPHDGGGYPEHVADELRAAAVDAVMAWSRGIPIAVPEPDAELLHRLLAIFVAEDVPEEYERLVRTERQLAGVELPTAPAPDANHVRSVLIIGAGLSGLIAGAILRGAGIPFTILERGRDVGGVWRSNTYPGAGVDTPSFLYSCSFFPWTWSSHFAKQGEMADYTSALADHFGLRAHIQFETTVDELSYDEHELRWTITGSGADGIARTWQAAVVISGVGTFNTPVTPPIPGLETFRGDVVHSADWPDDLDLTGRRVAVIGAGASAQQVVPAIVDRVASLHVLQRSPQWIAPNAEYFAPVPDDVHWLMEHVPFYFAWYRSRLMWLFNDRVHASLQIDPEWPHPDRSLNSVNEGHRQYFTRYITEQLEGRPDLIAKSVPAYPPFGKRMLLDNGWYTALRQPNVELDTSRIEEITEWGVRTAEGQHDVDVIVFCTGFAARSYLPFRRVSGRGGRDVHDEWGDDNAVAHLGMSLPGFPNLFVMYGPNTNGGAGGSVIFILECQARYIVSLLAALPDDRDAAIECRPEALARWVEDVDRAHSTMVWSHPGMTTYYRNSKGRVVTNMPYRIVDYWSMTLTPDLGDFDIEVAAPEPASATSNG